MDRKQKIAMTNIRKLTIGILAILCAGCATEPANLVWKNGQTKARLIAPTLTGETKGIVTSTLNDYLTVSYGWSIPIETKPSNSALNIVVGNQNNNPTIKLLAEQGLNLNTSLLSDEGFRILTHIDKGGRRFVIITANTPAGLKYGCQELMYFNMPASPQKVEITWPMDITKTPQFPYRGVYMLPCWAAYSSIENWKRVLNFHSELTINRNFFWLNGFPLIEKYRGTKYFQYDGSDLADVNNVRDLIKLCRTAGMKFYIGGGWFTWHHADASGLKVIDYGTEPGTPENLQRGIQYYKDMLALLPGTEGIYLEPPGEEYDIDPAIRKTRTDAFKHLTESIWAKQPDFEFAIAIGKFNDKSYRKAIHDIDDKRIYWCWGWGDPVTDNALAEHPLTLRWHTSRKMSDIHGSTSPPKPEESSLPGFYTSYDPGMGYGNNWNGQPNWPPSHGKDNPLNTRNFDPYTMPYFSHQYWYRERCWNVNITPEQFANRLSNRLFDSDMPAESIDHYLTLADICPNPKAADEQTLAQIETFVTANSNKGTPRNRDTIKRMQEALAGITASR